jgi:hypothetical protein
VALIDAEPNQRIFKRSNKIFDSVWEKATVGTRAPPVDGKAQHFQLAAEWEIDI